MGGSQPNLFNEQKEAIKNGLISFDINIYFIGENIESLYTLFENKKKEETDSLFSYWKYFYNKGDYEYQLKTAKEKFEKIQKKYIDNPDSNTFKEVIIIQLKNKKQEKLDEIFELFGNGKDIYCPFIIFLFEEDDSVGKNNNKIIPDNERFYISPLKIFNIKYSNEDYSSIINLYQILFRICSYYNELGDRIVVWPDSAENDFPIDYNLIEGDFNSYINIFCLGRTGCGKSTFINKFFNEKKSKEGGTGISTTSKICSYGINFVPIRIYDIPGFESNKTVQIVNDKLTEKTDEMNNDRDTIHCILYFINYESKTIFYEMEKNLINTLKTNNKDIKIIFIFTHSKTDPYKIDKIKDSKKFKKIKKELEDKIESLVNNVNLLFGDSYSYNNDYFQKDSLIQKNIIFTNLLPNDETDTKEFGFDKIIKSILESISLGVNKEKLININTKIMDNLSKNIHDYNKLDKEIKKYIDESYVLKTSTFSVEKDKAIEEATNLYNNLFTAGKVFASFCPIIKDINMGINKYQKYKFKKQLKKIFGFNIQNESFKDVRNDYIQMLKKYIEEKEAQRGKNDKNDCVQKIRNSYHKTEVNSGLIVANEAVGYASYALLFNPITFLIGGVGIIGTSYISYNQFKTDCTEYFEKYKKHYEEYKYRSLTDCINSLIFAIEYLEKYINNMNL